MHGDDFTFEGPADALSRIPDELREFWLIKVRGLLGPDSTDDKEVSILNRVVRWENGDILYEADPRHVEKLLRDLGMENCKPLTTPGVKPICPPPLHGEEEEVLAVEPLPSATQTLYRGGGGGSVQLFEF